VCLATGAADFLLLVLLLRLELLVAVLLVVPAAHAQPATTVADSCAATGADEADEAGSR
jgi:hypothetical protein